MHCKVPDQSHLNIKRELDNTHSLENLNGYNMLYTIRRIILPLHWANIMFANWDFINEADQYVSCPF